MDTELILLDDSRNINEKRGNMDEIVLWIRDKIEYIDNVMEQFNADDIQRIGSVYCNNSRGTSYYVKKIHTHGRDKKLYLGKADSADVLAERNAQLNSGLYSILQHDKKVLQECANQYKSFDVPSIEGLISPCLRNIKTDFMIDGRMKELFDWAHQPYERNPAPFPDKVILTKDGTKARSKDECILYDLFDDASIPNRYDCVMEFEDPWHPGLIIKRAPDFIILTLRGNLIIVEHAGLLLKPEYAEKLKEKIQLYLHNNFVLGVNFFITSEDRFGGIDERSLQRLVEEIKYRILYW